MLATAQSVEATPILDSATLPPRKRKSFGSMALPFVFAILSTAVMIAASNNARQTRNAPVDYVFPTFILAIFLGVVTHELGHLSAGWIVKLRFDSFAVGPISLHLEYGKLTIRLRRSLPAGGYAGMRVDRVRKLRRRLLIFVAGGPIANLLLAMATALFLTYAPPKSNGLAALLDMFWMMSAILGMINLVPFRTGLLFSDGARILILLSSVPKSRRWLSQNGILSQNHAGVRPKAWRRTWLEAAGRVRDGSIDEFAGNWICYLAANDRKDISAAALHLERCLELTNLLGPFSKDLVALEAAVFTAWFREDAPTAQKWLTHVKKPRTLPELLRNRADIAVCCVRKDFGAGLTLWQNAFALIEKLPDTPVKALLRQGFLEWRGEICEREGSQVSMLDRKSAVLESDPA
jgi:hypothetical protein